MVAQQDTVCDATGITLEQLVNWEDFFRWYASTKRGLYKIYFRRAITNLLDNWRVFTSSRKRAQKPKRNYCNMQNPAGLSPRGCFFAIKWPNEELPKYWRCLLSCIIKEIITARC